MQEVCLANNIKVFSGASSTAYLEILQNCLPSPECSSHDGADVLGVRSSCWSHLPCLNFQPCLPQTPCTTCGTFLLDMNDARLRVFFSQLLFSFFFRTSPIIISASHSFIASSAAHRISASISPSHISQSFLSFVSRRYAFFGGFR
jgi:hypothetical protein